MVKTVRTEKKRTLEQRYINVTHLNLVFVVCPCGWPQGHLSPDECHHRVGDDIRTQVTDLTYHGGHLQRVKQAS